MPSLDVGEPFRDNVQEGRVETNGSTDDGDDYPSLTGLVRSKQLISPVVLTTGVEVTLCLFPAGLAAQALPGGILDPICARVSVMARVEEVCKFGGVPMVVKSWARRQ